MENNDQSFEEYGLLEYVKAIFARKRLVSIIVLVCVSLTAVYSLYVKNTYRSRALIAPVSAKDAGGTLAMLSQQIGGLASLGISPSGASASEIVSLLKSNVLREKVIEKYHLLPVFFNEMWDREKRRWKKETSSTFTLKLSRWANSLNSNQSVRRSDGMPTVWDGLRKFDEIVAVKNNMKENSILITVDFTDPQIANEILEYLLSTLTDHMSGEAKRVALTNRKYLETQLNETSDPLIKQKIYNLIAQQLETSMMAEAKENFAFKIIDPPIQPDRKIAPRRAVMVIIAFIVSLFVSMWVAIFLEFRKKIKQTGNDQLASRS